jgi:hypothetical protein
MVTQPSPRVGIKETANAALDRAEAVLAQWLPEGRRQGPEWLARNPTRPDNKPGSFSVNLKTGQWADFAEGDKGGDLVSLVAYLDGTPTQGEAARRLADWLGIAPTETRPNGHERPTAAPAPAPPAILTPIPREALATRPTAHPKHGTPSATWVYRDVERRPLFAVLRFDPPGTRKQFAPLSWNGTGWQWQAPPSPRPLYGLDRLAARPAALVLLCEGEKASDAGGELLPGTVSIASMNGAQSPARSDWSPLKGRRVLIWPDNDAPGAAYARKAAELALAAGAASCAILDLASLADDLPPGWDAADCLADGWDTETLAARVRWIEFNAPGNASNPAPPRPEPADDWPDPQPLPERGDVGEASPFPLALLPEALHAAAHEVSRFTKVDPAAPALVGIGTLATAIGKRAMIEERPGLHHHPALFLVGIAPSGERKSPVFRAMARPLEDWSADAAVAWEATARQAKAKNLAIDAALTAAKSKAAKSGDVDAAARDIDDLEARRATLPPYPRLFTSDATEQRLFVLMHERAGAFAVLSGEGRPVIDAILGKYSGDGRTGDGVYLSGVSGDTITRDRVGGGDGPEDRVITRPCLNVCILIQPDKYLEAATHPSLRASGALARIWPAWLPSKVGTRMEAPGEAGLSPEAMAPYNALVRQLLDHEPPSDPDGHPIPHRATLSPDAREARRIFHNEVERLMGEGGELDDVRDIASKAVSQTAKLALLLHLAADPEALARPMSVIDGRTWATAQTIGTWFLTEAVRVQRLADEDPGLEAARRILRWLRTDPRQVITASDLMTIGPRPRPKARQAVEILNRLEDTGWLRSENGENKRRPVYRVHPRFATFATFAR